jgi:hypothetical protein
VASKPTAWVPQEVGRRMNPWGGLPTAPFRVRSIAVMSIGSPAAVFGRPLSVVSSPKSDCLRLAPDWSTIGPPTAGRSTIPNLAGSPV